MANVQCIYHKNCADGLSAAAVVLNVHPEMEEVDFLPMHYGDILPRDWFRGEVLYIVDFSLPPELMTTLAKGWFKIVVLDHHESAVRKYDGWKCPDNVELVFDMKRSGAILAWEYLSDKPAPLSLKCVQDRDLWQWELPETAAFSAALSIGKQTPLSYYKMLFYRKTDAMVNLGAPIVSYQKQQVAKVFADKRVNFCGHNVPILNSTTLISEIGNKLAKDEPFVIIYFIKSDDVVISLRSDKNGLNVAEIAEGFGGGGHYHAAGFKLPLAEFVKSYLGEKHVL